MGSKNFSSHQERFNTIVLLALAHFLLFGNAVQAQNLIWAKKAGGDSGIYSDSDSDIAVDAFGNSYVIGHFGGTATFGGGETNETILNSVDKVDIFWPNTMPTVCYCGQHRPAATRLIKALQLQ